jgi:hypothetical protein
MANPNPSPATRFGADNPSPGRAKQKGARDRLSAAFLTAFADDFEEHGATVIQTVRDKDPGTYLRVAASLQPKEIAIEERTPENDLSDEQLEQLYAKLLADLAAKAEAAKGDGQ